MSKLWGLLNAISYLTLFSLITVHIPGLARDISSVILSCSQFDIFPTDIIYNWAFSFDDKDDEPLSFFFDEFGFSTKNTIKNMGSSFIFLVMNVLLYCIGGIILLLSKKYDK
jgi:hypothetical protein